jgi:site-specific recombinase XerD
LAYSTATWLAHANAIQVFVKFCFDREIDLFECTPYTLNLYLLHSAQSGKSFGSLQRFLNALSFVLRFFEVTDIVKEPSVYELKRFLAKVCPHISNKKHPFGSAEVRALWDRINADGGLSKLSQTELRTFVMTVTQHATFCRFSDLQNVTLNDVLYELDYVKIHIRYSKTDQAGIGHTVFLPKNYGGRHDAHMLLCLYLTTFPDDNASPESVFLFPPLS